MLRQHDSRAARSRFDFDGSAGGVNDPALQRPSRRKLRPDFDRAESESDRPDTEHRSVKVIENMRAPGMAVGTARFRFLKQRRQPETLHLPEHIEAAEISEAVAEVAVTIIEAVHSVLERTPPELASDIYQNGITLTGGGALLGGLCRRVQATLRIPCSLAENPADCVARGTGMALENMELYGDLVYDYHKPVRYDFRR